MPPSKSFCSPVFTRHRVFGSLCCRDGSQGEVYFSLSTFFFLPLPEVLFVYVIDSAMVLHPPKRAEEGGNEPLVLISKPAPDLITGPRWSPVCFVGRWTGLRVTEAAPAVPRRWSPPRLRCRDKTSRNSGHSGLICVMFSKLPGDQDLPLAAVHCVV